MPIEALTAETRYLGGDYLAKNPDWHEDDAPWKAAQIARMLGRHPLAASRVCEIGCGSGACTEAIAGMFPGATTTGFEISPDAFAMCAGRARPGLDFVNGSPFGSNETFDLAVALDVIEHVEDPFAFVRDMAAISRHQLFHIPLDMNALAVGRDWPLVAARQDIGHIHYFSRNSALALLAECGLTVLDEAYTPWAIDQAGKTWRKRLAAIPRRLGYRVAPHAAVRLVGGWSLLVLTGAVA